MGSVLGDGTHSFTATAPHLVAQVAGWNLQALTLTPPSGFTGGIQLQVVATAIETATGGSASAVLQLDLRITGAADMPILTLTARDVAVSRELASTSWESVRDTGKRATIVNSATLEGWTMVTGGVGPSQFEIWSTGDSMPNAAGAFVPVQAAPGNGRNFLQLNDGKGLGHQSLGIERSFATIAGAVYTLTLDYAGALGQPAQNTRIVVYVDDQAVGNYAGTSSNSALQWQALSFQFGGNGGTLRLRIQLEGSATIANGRGAMVDDLRIVETLPSGNGTVYGLADTAIALPRIDARLTDTSGAETLKVELLNLPAGAVLSDGTRTLTLTGNTAALDISSWNLANLSLRPPAGYTGTLQLQVRATSTETASGATASVTRDLTVVVLSGTAAATPVNVNPYVSVSSGATLSNTPPTTAPAAAAVSLGQFVLPVGVTAVPVAALAGTARTPQEEEAADAERAKALADQWLRDLEVSAKAYWTSLGVGG